MNCLNRILKLAFAAAALLGVSAPPAISYAQPNNSLLSGEIMQDKEADRVDTNSEIQDKTIAYFQDLQRRISDAASGTPPQALSPLSENSLTYLNLAYLHCTINAGTCPAILDALLEVDVINSRLASKAACPNLKQFWKLWIKGQMEERQSFLVKTAFLATTENFKKTQRSQYIKCDATVAEKILGESSNTDFFKRRYAAEATERTSAETVVKILKEIKAEVPDIFSALK